MGSEFDSDDSDAVSETWISEIGLTLYDSVSVHVGVLDTITDGVVECPAVVPTCFKAGIVKVMQIWMYRLMSLLFFISSFLKFYFLSSPVE